MQHRRHVVNASHTRSSGNAHLPAALSMSGKRETVLDIITEARASLQKPSRPFTPATNIAISNDNAHPLNRIPLPPTLPDNQRPTTPRRLGPLRSADANLNQGSTHRDYFDLKSESHLSRRGSDELVEGEYDTTAKAHDDFRIHSARSSRTASAKTLAGPSSEWTQLLSVLSLPQNPLDQAWDMLEGMNWLTQSSSMEDLAEVRQRVVQKLNVWISIGRDQHSRGNQNEENMLMIWDACALTIKVAATDTTIAHALEIMGEVGTADSTPSRRSIQTVLELLMNSPAVDIVRLSVQESAIILLKSLTLSDTGRDIVVSEKGVEILVNGLRRSIDNADSGDYKDFVAEVLATLRNIVTDSTTCSQFVKARAIVPILDILDEHLPYSSTDEIMWHASRLLSKFSTDSECIDALTMSRITISSIMGVIVKYQGHQPLLVRLLFVLGNLTCTYPSRNHEKLSEYIPEIVGLLNLYAQEAFKVDDRSSLSDDHIQILVKLVRLVANMALDKSLAHDMLGMMELEYLVELLDPSFEDEELLLNVVASIANFTYYASISPNCIINRRVNIAERATNYLVHANPELVIEAVRIIANISRFPDVRNVFATYKAPEIISLLTAHQDHDIGLQACGAIINMAADSTLRDMLIRDGVLDGLSDALENVLEDNDWEFGCVVAQAISNLGKDAIDDKMAELLDIAYDVARNTPEATNFVQIIAQLK